VAPTLLVTGSSGLIGSQAVRHFSPLGWRVVGVDNHQRREFFGPEGDPAWNLALLRQQCPRFEHQALDVRDREGLARLVERERPGAIVHCAAQPSHDLAAQRPFDDFEVNALGTLNLLEAARRSAPDAPFVFLSTNKVYGDAPNELPRVELPRRFDYARPEDFEGIDEHCRLDRSLHSLFGVSKAAADLLVQEYGRHFGLPTVCLRGGCLTGPAHSGAPLHGFLSYLVRTAVAGRAYTVIGYGGKQVRDQLHADDVCRAIERVIEEPRSGEVYNLGGGRASQASLLECLDLLEQLLGHPVPHVFERRARVGDHACYISDTRRFRTHYPGWAPTRDVPTILAELVRAAHDQRSAA
jgi:CDP-paratose 2-epimerase